MRSAGFGILGIVMGLVCFEAVWCCAEETKAGQKTARLKNSIGMTFRKIPAGEFLMGSVTEDPQAAEDERPAHRVRITKPFFLGIYEVTQTEYEKVQGANPSWFSHQGPGRGELQGADPSHLPVDMVTWFEAVEFCRKLSELPAEKAAGRVYRLPTEAEWESACRAGTTTPYSTGEVLASTQARFRGQDSAVKQPVAVGTYPPNPFGIHDMHGNVWEWCADWYGPATYRTTPETDPQGPESGTGRVIRGGAWNFDANYCRSANRDFTRASRRDLGNGFRVVCNP